MRYSNRLANANHQALKPQYDYDEDDEMNSGYVVQGESSLCHSAITSGSQNSAAPSALRRGKYSSYPYARSDIDSGDESNSLGSSISSYNSYGKPYHNSSSYDNRRYSDSRYTDTYVDQSYDFDYCYDDFEQEKRTDETYLPTNIVEMKSQRSEITSYISDRGLPSNIVLSNGVRVGATGYILGRHTRLSIMFKKKWKDLIWVHCKPTTIIFFDSQDDCLRWMKQKYLSSEKKKKLIKHAIDFDAMGILKEKDNQENSNQLPSAAGMTKYKMTDVRAKREDVDNSYSYRFAVDRWRCNGTSVEMMFRSSQVLEIKQLRKAIRKCLKKIAAQEAKQESKNDRSHQIHPSHSRDSYDDAESDISEKMSKLSSTSFDSINSHNGEGYSKGKISSRTRKHRHRRF